MTTTELGQRLLAACETLADPRSRLGQRHPLGAILALRPAAMRSGAQRLAAIAQWGRLQDAGTRRTWGFTRDRCATGSTLDDGWTVLDAAALAAALAWWSHAAGIGAGEGVALDGTARRGSEGRTGGVGRQLVVV